MKRIPYSFDQPAYDLCFRDPAEAMDKRHIFIVHQILASWLFVVGALELGSWLARELLRRLLRRSTAGRRCGRHSAMCQVTQGLQNVVNNCKNFAGGGWTIANLPSWELLPREDQYDFILVDAYHDIQSVSRRSRRTD